MALNAETIPVEQVCRAVFGFYENVDLRILYGVYSVR